MGGICVDRAKLGWVPFLALRGWRRVRGRALIDDDGMRFAIISLYLGASSQGQYVRWGAIEDGCRKCAARREESQREGTASEVNRVRSRFPWRRCDAPECDDSTRDNATDKRRTRCGKGLVDSGRGSIDVSMGLNLAFVDVVGMASNNRRIVFTRGAAG